MKRSGKASPMKRNGKASMTTLARHLYNLYNLLLTLHSSPSTLLCSPRTYGPSIEVIQWLRAE
jgi:hypothetical protein